MGKIIKLSKKNFISSWSHMEKEQTVFCPGLIWLPPPFPSQSKGNDPEVKKQHLVRVCWGGGGYYCLILWGCVCRVPLMWSEGGGLGAMTTGVSWGTLSQQSVRCSPLLLLLFLLLRDLFHINTENMPQTHSVRKPFRRCAMAVSVFLSVVCHSLR